jgi:hypothetical protein
MRFLVIISLFILFLSACGEDETPLLNENILSEYIELNGELELSDLIACAGGKAGGIFNNSTESTSIIYYPENNPSDIRYFETSGPLDSMDFSQFVAKELSAEPLFNGYLWKFNNEPFEGERLGIVTYIVDDTLHISNPITLKVNDKPTEVNPNLVVVEENGTTPNFTWQDGEIAENAIYFQVISDMENNLISGTYTFDQEFTFYDLDNVVLNITDALSTPTLLPDQDYKFTMMGVSLDNWVNVLIEKDFRTN